MMQVVEIKFRTVSVGCEAYATGVASCIKTSDPFTYTTRAIHHKRANKVLREWLNNLVRLFTYLLPFMIS